MMDAIEAALGQAKMLMPMSKCYSERYSFV